VALAGFVTIDLAIQSDAVAVAAFGVFFGVGVLCLYGVISLVGIRDPRRRQEAPVHHQAAARTQA